MRTWLLLSLFLNLVGLIGIVWLTQRLGGINYLRYRLGASQHIGAVYQHRVEQLAQLPLPPDATVLLGNSLTQQGNWSELLGRTVYNRGIGGDVTDHLLKRLTPLTQAQPRRVYLLIGINDLLFHPPDYVLRNYRRLLERFRAETPRTEVIVTSLLPVNNEVRRTGIDNVAVRAVNAELPALAAEFDYPFLELHTAFTDATGKLDARFTLDGIHLNGAGYATWVQTLRSAGLESG